jgi:hypothetical protein
MDSQNEDSVLKEMKLFVGLVPDDFELIKRTIANFKEQTDKVFSKLFIANFDNVSDNSVLMKTWAVFSKDLEDWNRRFFKSGLNKFFPTVEHDLIKKNLDELYDIFKGTYESLMKTFYLL